MSDPFFHPVSGFDLPRFAGVPTFMRLPHIGLDDPKLKDVEIGVIDSPCRRGGLLDPRRVIQIGIRGTTYDNEDRDFADSVGIRVIPIEEFHARGAEDVMAEARALVGDAATYVSYDIDFVDPAFAPGTGTPEVGGPNSYQAIQVARLLEGINIVGADLVEVSPPFDATGGTAYLGVSIMFEMLCNMAVKLSAN